MNETETFQHYQVLRREDGSLWELGRGAMGVTYKAFDVNLRCHVALKVISSQFLDSEVARARFLREARAAAGLRHRNVASVYHLGDDEVSFFYSMEFIDGETVEALVGRTGPLPPATALQIVLQVARALGAAAKQGVVHRDIKPANLMVVHEDDDEEQGLVVKVIDFGLARSALSGGEHSGHITMGGFVGTPQYASPEQIEEKDLDGRSDIYSLGITLWYMLVGQPPFTGTVFRISSQHLTKDPPWEEIKASVSPPVRTLLGHMLQKDPASRPQTAAKLRAEIEHCLRQLPAEAAAPVARMSAPTEDADTAAPEDLAANVTVIQGPAPTEGRIFAGRYQLAALAGEGASGRIFRAYDGRLDGKLIAVKVLHPELHLSPQAFYHLQSDLGRLRDAPHPQLIETFLLERIHGYKFSVMEWINGFPLARLLQRRGALPLRDALCLLGQAADAAAHCSAHRLHHLELSARKALLQFPDVPEDVEAPDDAALTHLNLGQWPRFRLKLDALSLGRQADRSSAASDKGSGVHVPGRDTLSNIRGLVEGSYFYALGVMLHELLGAQLPSSESPRKMPSLSALSEAGNAMLRRAFSANPGFASENEFFQSLLAASDLRREDVGLSRPLTEAPPLMTARASARPPATHAQTRAPQPASPAETRLPPPPVPPLTKPVPPVEARAARKLAASPAVPSPEENPSGGDAATTLARPAPVPASALPSKPSPPPKKILATATVPAPPVASDETIHALPVQSTVAQSPENPVIILPVGEAANGRELPTAAPLEGTLARTRRHPASPQRSSPTWLLACAAIIIAAVAAAWATFKFRVSGPSSSSPEDVVNRTPGPVVIPADSPRTATISPVRDAKASDPPSHDQADKIAAASSPAPTIGLETHPIAEAVAPSPTPDVPPVMTVVAEASPIASVQPASTPATVVPTPRVTPILSKPTPTPRRGNKAADTSSDPRKNNAFPTPPKSKPVATKPLKTAPTPPDNNEDVPGFMR